MPYIFETDTRVDTLVSAINVILASDGQAGLTLRNIRRVSGGESVLDAGPPRQQGAHAAGRRPPDRHHTS